MTHDVQLPTHSVVDPRPMIDPNLLIEVGNASRGCGCGGHHEANAGQCPVAPPEFPRFFPGQLVEPEDLSAIQHRVFTHEQLRARHTIGWGIACGFRIAIDGAAPAANVASAPKQSGAVTVAGAVLRVESGYGLDRFGRDVYLAETRRFSLQELLDEREARIKQVMGDPWCVVPGCEPTPATHFCVAVRYKECEDRPVPSYAQQCGTPKTVCEYSRIREDVEIRLFADNEFPALPPGPAGDWCAGGGDPSITQAFMALLQIPHGETDAAPSQTTSPYAGLAANVAGMNLRQFAESVECIDLLHLARPCEPCIDWPWIPLACFTLERGYVTAPDCRVRRTIYSLQEIEALVVRMFCLLANQSPRSSKVTLADAVHMLGK